MNTQHLIIGLCLNLGVFFALIYFVRRMRHTHWIMTPATLTNVTFDADSCMVLHLDVDIESSQDTGKRQRRHVELYGDRGFWGVRKSEIERRADYADGDIVHVWYAEHNPQEIHLDCPNNTVRFFGALAGAGAMFAFLYYFGISFFLVLMGVLPIEETPW